MLRAGWGGEVAGNVTGANMPEGHVAALCASRAARVVLETDEAWLPAAVRATSPAVVVLLNLSRDQLDRANEVRQMAQRWRDCLSAPELLWGGVANAADPLVVYAAADQLATCSGSKCRRRGALTPPRVRIARGPWSLTATGGRAAAASPSPRE